MSPRSLPLLELRCQSVPVRPIVARVGSTIRLPSSSCRPCRSIGPQARETLQRHDRPSRRPRYPSTGSHQSSHTKGVNEQIRRVTAGKSHGGSGFSAVSHAPFQPSSVIRPAPADRSRSSRPRFSRPSPSSSARGGAPCSRPDSASSSRPRRLAPPRRSPGRRPCSSTWSPP